MKITIEPSNKTVGESFECITPTVTMDCQTDGIVCADLFSMFAALAVASGYHPHSVAECLSDDLAKEIFVTTASLD